MDLGCGRNTDRVGGREKILVRFFIFSTKCHYLLEKDLINLFMLNIHVTHMIGKCGELYRYDEVPFKINGSFITYYSLAIILL